MRAHAHWLPNMCFLSALDAAENFLRSSTSLSLGKIVVRMCVRCSVPAKSMDFFIYLLLPDIGTEICLPLFRFLGSSQEKSIKMMCFSCF